MQTNPLISQSTEARSRFCFQDGFVSYVQWLCLQARETPSLARCDAPVSERILSRHLVGTSHWPVVQSHAFPHNSLSFWDCTSPWLNLCAQVHKESPRYGPASQHPEESASETSNHLFLGCLKSDRSPIEDHP